MATATKAIKATKRPFSAKTRELEPRGRPAKGTRTLSGATSDDPLVNVQIPASLKILTSLWDDLAAAALEQKWHRSVLVREILVEWVKRWKAGKKRSGAGKKAA